MNSCLFDAKVSHGRMSPKKHRFHYTTYLFGFDLDELDELDRQIRFFGYNRFAITRLNDADYLAPGGDRIKDKVLRTLTQKGVHETISRVMLVTAGRYFNRGFNPVSFYYCYGPAGELVCVVCEVNNTFQEKHLYVLTHPDFEKDGSLAVFSSRKEFHVSPFNQIDGHYEFKFLELKSGLDVRIALIKDGQSFFFARLEGSAIPLTSANHSKMLLRRPVVALLTTPRIFWQAARLRFQKKLTYHKKPLPLSPDTIRVHPPSTFQKKCMKILFAMFAQIRTGGLQFHLPEGKSLVFGSDSANRGIIQVRDYRFFSRTLTGGDIGLGESYTAFEWDSPDLVRLFRVLVENREAFGRGRFFQTLLKRLFERFQHFSRRNTRIGSRRNIRSHYDLGNDFYRMFLDDSMMYSCAWFRSPNDSLQQAQMNKLQAIIDKAQIQPTDHVLEIGCGWGSFAIEAAKQTGCKVTAITISRAQHVLARQRVDEAGLSENVEILLMDYRDLHGRFDKIVSIEMLEAIGPEHYKTFFQQCQQLLNPDGLMVLQAITLPDYRFQHYRKRRDWIQKHIFPGGMLLSVTALSRAMEKHSQFMIEHAQNIGIHYAKTLALWRKQYLKNKKEVSALGYDEAFHRKWLYYFSICESLFASRELNDMQLVLTRPGNQRLLHSADSDLQVVSNQRSLTG